MRSSPRGLPVLLFVDHTARLGGGEMALLRLLGALDRERFTPAVVLLSDGPLRDLLVARGLSPQVLPLTPAVLEARKDALRPATLLDPRIVCGTIAEVWRLRRAIRKSGAHLVHTNSLKSHLIGGAAARLAGVPVVWHVRDRIAPDYLPPWVVPAFRRLARWVPTAVIANSQATLATLAPTAGDPPRLGRRPGWVVYDGTTVDAAGGEGRTEDRGADAVVGMVGRLTEWKGQHVFIEAAARVRRRFPRARFRIHGAALFGETAYERRLHAAVDALGLGDVFSFCGFRPDIRTAIGQLDVLVHASVLGEPFGQVIIEGMAAGRAVVATRGGGVPEIIRDGDTGLLVPMNDPAAMAAAIERLLGDPAERAALGERGRQRVIAHFTIEKTAAGLEAVFERVLNGER